MTYTLVSALLLSALAGKPPPITVSATPHTGFAPLTIHITVRIEPTDANRSACVVADGEIFYRSSCWMVEGVNAPRTTWVEFRDLPPGQYDISATVVRVDGSTSTNHTEVIALGMD
jgi:hypothetical protein